MDKTLFSILISVFVMTFNAWAEKIPAVCSAGETGCQSSDYLEASEEEIGLLGKQSFHANIALVEKALKERGVVLPEKGFITSEFRNALMSYQESVGLKADGQINQATLDKLGVKF